MKDKLLPYEPDQPYLFPPSPQEWLLKATRRLKRRLQSERGRALYKRRKAIVEPVFGMIKHVLGLRGCLKMMRAG